MAEIYGFQPEEATGEAWEINLDSPELNNLRERHPEISEVEFNRMVDSASNILSRCPSPRVGSGRKTGLAIGRVQSGKTLSFTSLISLASLNGYGIIVVLAGTKKALLNQTYTRLRTDLGIAQNSGASRIYIQRNPRMNLVDSLTSALQSNRCVLLVALKNARYIPRLTEVIGNLPSRPVLIIDDEGDEASLNNYFRRGEESATYRTIRELRDSLKGRPHAYIAYTATPQANLLLDVVDNFSPDFCELIEPGSGYCGGGVFFGSQNNNYIRLIDDVNQDAAEDGSIPNSLRRALAIFFVSAVIRHKRIEYQKHSMLIHMNVKTEAHRRISASISRLVNNWKQQINLRSDDPSRQTLINFFRVAYKDLLTTVANPPSWKEVERRLPRELTSSEFYMVNSLPEGTQLDEGAFQLDNHIVIGGNILGRGLTIQNLTISYMTRRARRITNADTMEQRARWFGYKREYLDLCRIFLPERIRSDYEELMLHEEDFWESLRRNINQGIPLNEWSRFFRLDTELGLHPTRASVASYRSFQPRDWDMQNIPIANQRVVDENLRHVNKFFRAHNARTENIGGNRHTIIRDCPVNQVIRLLRRINTEGTDWESSYNIEYLERLRIQRRLTSMDVVLMSKGEPRIRSLTDNGRVNNLMEGRNPNYPGDRNIHNNRVQLQIHHIQCRNAFRTTALALYMPDDDKFNLSFVVRGVK